MLIILRMSILWRLTTGMALHLRDRRVLTTLVLLLLKGLVVHSLLLLVAHVTAMGRGHGLTGLLGWRHGGDVWRAGNVVGCVDAVLAARWFRSVETGLSSC